MVTLDFYNVLFQRGKSQKPRFLCLNFVESDFVKRTQKKLKALFWISGTLCRWVARYIMGWKKKQPQIVPTVVFFSRIKMNVLFLHTYYIFWKRSTKVDVEFSIVEIFEGLLTLTIGYVIRCSSQKFYMKMCLDQ